jgi:dolichol-phosphate mannosyltransferase
MKKIVIILPTYNEKENIEDMVKLVLTAGAKIPGWKIEVLVSDSHSPDGTGKIVEKLNQKEKNVYLLDVKERGIGIGLVKGYQYAFDKLEADAVIQMDADLQHNPEELPAFIKALDRGYEFVQGSRFVMGGANKLEWYRQVLSRGANIVSGILLGINQVHEFTASYRAFTKELFKRINMDEIPWRSSSFIFQPAFLFAAVAVLARITEVPITFIDRERGYSKMEYIRYMLDILFFGARMRIKKSERVIKFATVGTIGFVVNTIAFKIFDVVFTRSPLLKLLGPANTYALAFALGAEIAIASNFILNNRWTFKSEQIVGIRRALLKYIQFNITSLGAVIIGSTTMWIGVNLFGAAMRDIYYIAGIGISLFWNYTMYTRVIWKTTNTNA